MPDPQWSFTAELAPRSNTAALLRIVSILHSRGTKVHELQFASNADDRATMTAHVTLGNIGHTTLRQSLLRPVEVIDVVAVSRGAGSADVPPSGAAARPPRVAVTCRGS